MLRIGATACHGCQHDATLQIGDADADWLEELWDGGRGQDRSPRICDRKLLAGSEGIEEGIETGSQGLEKDISVGT